MDTDIELAVILATGYLRYRRRQVRQVTRTFFEKTLDDVGDSAKFDTGETRTLEKGATSNDG